MKEAINIFPNGQAERGNGKPGYDWVPAYSQRLDNGAETNPMTMADWRAIAKRDGKRLVVLKATNFQERQKATESKAKA